MSGITYVTTAPSTVIDTVHTRVETKGENARERVYQLQRSDFSKPDVMDDPSLLLCADGGGTSVSVVIIADDGTEVRGSGGPCNVYVPQTSAQLTDEDTVSGRKRHRLPS
jgi:hypothetical protein